MLLHRLSSFAVLAAAIVAVFSINADASQPSILFQDGGLAPWEDAQAVRFGHFSPGLPSLDLVIQDEEGRAEVIAVITYGEVSPYQKLVNFSEAVTLSVRLASNSTDVLVEMQTTLAAHRSFTVAAVGTPASLALTILTDSDQPVAFGKSMVRLFNAAPDHAPVQVWADELFLFSASFNNVTDYVTVPESADYRLFVFPLDSTTGAPLVTVDPFPLASGTVNSIFIYQSPEDHSTTGVAPVVDTTAAASSSESATTGHSVTGTTGGPVDTTGHADVSTTGNHHESTTGNKEVSTTGAGEVSTTAAVDVSTTSVQPESSTTAKPADVSTTATPADVSTTATPADVSTTATPADVSTTATPADVSTTAKPADVSTTAQQDVGTTAAPNASSTEDVFERRSISVKRASTLSVVSTVDKTYTHIWVSFVNSLNGGGPLTVYGNEQVLFSNVAFMDVSPYAEVAYLSSGFVFIMVDIAGTKYQVPFEFEHGKLYTVIAEGDFASQNFTLHAVWDYFTPAAGFGAFRFAHALNNGPEVDVLLSGSVTFPNVKFGFVSEFVNLFVGYYNLTIVDSATKDVLYTSDSPFYVASKAAYTSIGVGNYGTAEMGVYWFTNFVPPSPARARVIQTVPVLTTGVDVFVNAVPEFENLQTETATDYHSFENGTLAVSVTATGTIAPVLSSAVTQAAPGSYNSILLLLNTTGPIIVKTVADNFIESTTLSVAQVRFIHAAQTSLLTTEIPGTGVVFGNFSFGEVSAYVNVTPGAFSIRVIDDKNTTDDVTGDNWFEAGKAYTIVAQGPSDNIKVAVYVDSGASPSPPPSTTGDSGGSPDAGSLSDGAKAGIVIGAIMGAALIIVIIVLIVRRVRRAGYETIRDRSKYNI